jgi:hypothetical protein
MYLGLIPDQVISFTNVTFAAYTFDNRGASLPPQPMPPLAHMEERSWKNEQITLHYLQVGYHIELDE